MTTVSLADVRRLWFHRQGLHQPRGTHKLNKRRLSALLEDVGALQLDSINVVDRAHYLTLWSRFGAYRRSSVDRWVYDEGVGYEYWGHEASILPVSHLPVGRRRMRRFPPENWKNRAWWPRFNTSVGSKRRVMRRLRAEGPLESGDFERQPGDAPATAAMMPMLKEDRRSLKLLWHAGKVAVAKRRHFRCVFDLAERVYPDGPAASPTDYEDSWLFAALRGNGIAGWKHLNGYFTAPEMSAEAKRRVIARNLRRGRIVQLRVEGSSAPHYALPADLDDLSGLEDPVGTTLLCPFDSFLWQRARAEQLLGFHYRIEIYVPQPKRQFGYYVLPILHDGRLVGRLDPKMHRDREELEIKALYMEPDFRPDARFDRALAETLDDLAAFLGATRFTVPRGWRRRLG